MLPPLLLSEIEKQLGFDPFFKRNPQKKRVEFTLLCL